MAGRRRPTVRLPSSQNNQRQRGKILPYGLKRSQALCWHSTLRVGLRFTRGKENVMTGSGADSSVWTKSGALLYISADRASTAGLGVHNTPSRPNPGHTDRSLLLPGEFVNI